MTLKRRNINVRAGNAILEICRETYKFRQQAYTSDRPFIVTVHGAIAYRRLNEAHTDTSKLLPFTGETSCDSDTNIDQK